MSVADTYTRIGVAVVYLSRLATESAFSEKLELRVVGGRLEMRDIIVGTLGIEPTADDWEKLATEMGLKR